MGTEFQIEISGCLTSQLPNPRADYFKSTNLFLLFPTLKDPTRYKNHINP